MRRVAALLGAAAWLAACATQQWVYEKRSVTQAQYDHDMALCRKEATDPRLVSLPGSPRVDRAIFNRCMERRGYTVRMEK
ncbi:MAG: hypothetical protein DMD87_04510 [Candidatus Rokuibacteriota bacterium]|nr:MAG: hypothetical protein DMD87_04510 [Candidatus Rokubacteria bacterium]